MAQQRRQAAELGDQEVAELGDAEVVDAVRGPGDRDGGDDRAVDGAVVAAISVSGPTARINDRGITALGDLLVAETRGLSAQLGHHPGKEGSLS